MGRTLPLRQLKSKQHLAVKAVGDYYEGKIKSIGKALSFPLFVPVLLSWRSHATVRARVFVCHRA
jgi:hypothetical protein